MPRSLPPLLLFAAALSLATAAAADDTRPNILFIFTDDQSQRTVGCYEDSHPWVKTPNIDRLADEGVLFRHAYLGTWCLPSRAMMLTGLHPHAIRGLNVVSNPTSTYDPDLCRFWPAALRKAGYTTAFIGKWHLSEDAGHGRDWDHSVVWNHAVPQKAGGYKYIRTLVADEIEELYDLQADPEELVNLALDPQYAAILADYRRRLVGELKRTGARFVDNMPSPCENGEEDAPVGKPTQ